MTAVLDELEFTAHLDHRDLRALVRSHNVRVTSVADAVVKLGLDV
jgi:hypothetical protein